MDTLGSTWGNDNAYHTKIYHDNSLGLFGLLGRNESVWPAYEGDRAGEGSMHWVSGLSMPKATGIPDDCLSIHLSQGT